LVFPQLAFEKLKHFLFRSFFLYFYYSTNFSFVKRFLKKILKNFKIFFAETLRAFILKGLRYKKIFRKIA